ncbi:Na+/H+ antiporter NhaA [Thermobaculum terrenum ATCC BAA-798]|uniref:Na(+)/H(+) antiporter NhaA n=1 Tax=Thermobaculum terrenum (strain ATCC BAA-798 / CCMEE 7001 / YNP1) TaxID=525904 RepID=D1CHI5_THET1|nr:Na+/H+ antiporter NhaA [Thermobaculum terrenum]ACZ43206.1 Na+/H+ antiporter NhaA [Thermobaculum terrenum ATCC BAA-798]
MGQTASEDFVQREQPIRKLLYPLLAFMGAQSSSGILLIACTVIALLWANSPWGHTYDAFWHTKLVVGVGGYQLSLDLLHWINDGLMALFFFVVGLEIKRELLVGELSSLRQASLPIAAAVGGMLAPAAIYTLFNWGGNGSHGWGIPMATDIAFALGVLSLLGSRIPNALKVFLTALAIVDDIGAVLVIALFYTEDTSLRALLFASVVFLLLVACNVLHVRHPIPYALLGLVMWVAFLESGVHASISGVLVALTIPARTRVDTKEFLDRTKELLEEFDAAGEEGESILTNAGQQAAIREIQALSESAQTPMQRLDHMLHPWVAFAIMPVFALANAGVHLGGQIDLFSPVTLGVIAGLVLGKQIGIFVASWGSARLGLADLPEDTSWRMVYGAGWLGGIGFTMSLFIATLAFGNDQRLLDDAKVGILVGSLISGVFGLLYLRRVISRPTATAVTTTS